MCLTDRLCCQYFTVIEQTLPVNDYRMGDVHFWPFIRVMLYGPLVHRFLPAAGAAAWERIDVHYRALLSNRGLPLPKGLPLKAAEPAPAGDRSGMAFFTRPVEHSGTTPEGFFAPILDPWVEIAGEFGPVFKFELLDNLSLSQQPRLHPTFTMPPPSQPRFVAAQLALQQNGLPALHGLLLSLAEFSRRELLINIDAELNNLVGQFVACLAYKTEFSARLAALRPRALSLVCYYYSIGMAVVWACREQGVRTIELQHGANGDHHCCYTHWTVLPDGGYAPLPDIFMTWGRTSIDHVIRWWPHDNHPHRMMIGGRPGFAASAEWDANRAAAVETLAPLKARHRRTILIALSLESIAPLFADMIERAPRDWLWLIRCHPRISQDKVPGCTPAEVEAILTGRGLTNFETHVVTRVFLSSVLPYVDHLVTRESSCWMEASSFGIPTTFIDSQARGSYTSAIEERRAYYVDTLDALFETIEAGWNGLAANAPSIIDTTPDLGRRVFEQLLR